MEGRMKGSSRKKGGGSVEINKDRRKRWSLKVGQTGDPQVGAVSPATPPPPLIPVNPRAPRVEWAHDNDSSPRGGSRSGNALIPPSLSL